MKVSSEDLEETSHAGHRRLPRRLEPMSDKRLWSFGEGNGISLAIEHWPQHDLQRLREARDPIAMTIANRKRRPIAASSWTTYLYSYSLFLGFLARTSPDDLKLPISRRVNLERVTHCIIYLTSTGKWKARGIAQFIHAFRCALWRLAPSDNWDWLRRLAASFQATSEPRDITANFRYTAELFSLGQRLIEEAETALKEGSSAAEKTTGRILFRDGLMISFLALVPLRRANVASIRVGVGLVRNLDGYYIFVDGSSEKTGVGDFRAVPESLSNQLTYFIDFVRLSLVRGREHDYLWPCANGKPLTAKGLYYIITSRTKREFGSAVWPHLFRHAAATEIVLARADFKLTSSILNHAGTSNDKDYVHPMRGRASVITRQSVTALKKDIDEHFYF